MKAILISHLARWIIGLWFSTIRVQKIVIPDNTEKLLQNHERFILAIWHNQILSLTYHGATYLQKKRKIVLTPLVSLSKDGELINQTFLRFGMTSVRGSSSRGQVSGLRAILNTIKENRIPVFTPDGPRGPIYKLQSGVVHVASLADVPIIFFCSDFDRYYCARKAWDKHRFPKLFAKQWIEYSEPFLVPKGTMELEPYIEELEKKMCNQIERVRKMIEGESNNV